MTFRFVRLAVVALEGRDAPSVTAVAPPAAAVLRAPARPIVLAATPTAPTAPIAPSAANPNPHPTPKPTPTPGTINHHQLLTGGGQGDYISTLQVGGTASGFHFNGSALVSRLGSVDVYAHVYSVGFRSHGSAVGELTFSNARGSVVLALIGADQLRLAALPREFSYRVIRAKGAFRGILDAGTLRLVRTAGDPMRHGIHYFEAGTFRLTL